MAWIFLLGAGILFSIGTVRYILRGDIVGVVLYSLATLCFFVSAFGFYLHQKKEI